MGLRDVPHSPGFCFRAASAEVWFSENSYQDSLEESVKNQTKTKRFLGSHLRSKDVSLNWFYKSADPSISSSTLILKHMNAFMTSHSVLFLHGGEREERNIRDWFFILYPTRNRERGTSVEVNEEVAGEDLGVFVKGAQRAGCADPPGAQSPWDCRFAKPWIAWILKVFSKKWDHTVLSLS